MRGEVWARVWVAPAGLTFPAPPGETTDSLLLQVSSIISVSFSPWPLNCESQRDKPGFVYSRFNPGKRKPGREDRRGYRGEGRFRRGRAAPYRHGGAGSGGQRGIAWQSLPTAEEVRCCIPSYIPCPDHYDHRSGSGTRSRKNPRSPVTR